MEEISQNVREQEKNLVRLEAKIDSLTDSLKRLEKRISDNEEITKGVYQLASSIEIYSQKIDFLTESMDKRMTSLEERQTLQGQRIGMLEKEPAHKWKSFVAQTTSIIIAAVAGVVLAKFI